MQENFILRADQRGYNKLLSTGPTASYIAGHPDAVLTRHSSFNFGPYQEGIRGFGRIRVCGDEVFRGAGCGYDMHRHHNFIICAFVFSGTLTHINTVGKVDQLKAGDYYAFSTGSGGKHSELNLEQEDMNALYLWIVPNALLGPASYARNHYDAVTHRNRLVPLIGNADGALRIAQDVTVSRMSSNEAVSLRYTPKSDKHGVYVLVLDGEVHVNDTALGRRDSMGIWGEAPISIQTGEQDADVLVIESVE
jgi:redox-sensitive bicupin YhaK (pirin superfamily)